MPIDISKAKEENKRWKPKKLEKYFYVHTNLGGVSYYNWEDDKLDKEHYENGNVFRTKEEAEKAFEKVKETLLNFHKEISNNG